MKLPAIRAQIGVWKYYVSTMTFSDIDKFVKKVDDELHQSSTLSEMIQRSITDNYKKIKEYIINQNERFFNSLVLAVYDGNPEWVEVELNYGDDEEYFNMGFLKLNGQEKIFPVDGQHRVQGIIHALRENPELASEQVPVIFIGHSTSEDGMQRTRRLFSTLNRYAKPVSMRDIIALDEDDVVAIVTRDLLENHPLFRGDRVLDSQGKPIPETNKKAFTSVITLYDCNKSILKYFKQEMGIKKPTPDYLKYRPAEDEIISFKEYIFDFWNDFLGQIEVIKEYDLNKNESPAEKFRNRENGGHLVFRPIGLLPFVTAVFELKNRHGHTLNYILNAFNNINLFLNQQPWKRFIWNDIENKTISGDNQLVRLLLMYMYDKDKLKKNELDSLKAKYRGKIGDVEIAELILKQILIK